MLFRIPGRANGTTIAVNQQPLSKPVQAGFARVERVWKKGDVVELVFRMKPRIVRGGYANSLSLERGPLLFSYPVGESWVKLRTRGMTADWQVLPTGEWNYALLVDEENPKTILAEDHPLGGSSFALKESP